MQSRVSGKIRNTVHPFVETCKRSHLEKSGARQLKSRKPLRKTQGQASFLDRRVRNMENRRGPLNRRIRRYSILQQLNFGDTSCLFHRNSTASTPKARPSRIPCFETVFFAAASPWLKRTRTCWGRLKERTSIAGYSSSWEGFGNLDDEMVCIYCFWCSTSAS